MKNYELKYVARPNGQQDLPVKRGKIKVTSRDVFGAWAVGLNQLVKKHGNDYDITINGTKEV